MRFDFSDRTSKYALRVEDNGSVAYAYLLYGDKIVSDVWLYNHGLPPELPVWDNPNFAPFKNPYSYVIPGLYKPIESVSEIQIEWQYHADQSVASVHVFLRGELFAFLKPGERPGCSKFAMKNGPLARVMPK